MTHRWLLLLTSLVVASGCNGQVPGKARPPKAPPVTITGGHVIGAGGGNVIGAGGGNLIGQSGSNAPAPAVSAQDAGTRADGAAALIPDAISLPLPAALTGGASGYRVAQAPSSMALLLLKNIAGYRLSTALVEAILQQVKSRRVALNTPHHLELEDVGPVTVLVRRPDAEVVIAIGTGDSATANQLLGITYDPAARRGRAVFRPRKAQAGVVAFATRFDLAAGTGSADAVIDKRAAGEELARVHWELDARKTAARDFRLQVAAARQPMSAPDETGIYHLVAQFRSGDGAAAAFGRQTLLTRNAFVWYPNKQDDTGGHGHFLDARGEDMAPAEAPEALRALVPQAADRHQPDPVVPEVEALSAEEVFQLPN